MKVLAVLGTRPEAIKLYPVINALREDPFFDVKLCVSAGHRQGLDQVLALAELKPDYDLDLMQPDHGLVDLTARVLQGVDYAIADCAPDRVMVQGDSTGAMAAALAAFYRKVPVDHIEAGLRTGNIYSPWPEELNRKFITSIAALHFAPTPHAEDVLLREGLPPERVFVTGNTVIDALLDIRRRIDKFTWVRDAVDGSMLQATGGRRIVLIAAHRRENVEAGAERIVEAVRQIAARDDCFVVLLAHGARRPPDALRLPLEGHPRVKLLPALDYVPFVHVLSHAYLVITDSGGLQEEAPALGKPVLVMRDNTDRPEGIDAGTARLVGTAPERIAAETFRLLDDIAHYGAMSRAETPFGDGRAGHRIRNILRSEANTMKTPLEYLRHAS